MIRGSTIPIAKGRERSVVANLNIHNRFDIEVVDAATGKVKQKAEAYNVVCNNYWQEVIGTRSRNWFEYIHYGDGAGIPSETDSDMFHFVDSQAVTNMTVGGSAEDGYAYCRKMIQLSETTAVDINITEVGIGFLKEKGTLCTHAMLQDMNGNQISIKKTDTDIINIYATVYVHWNPNGYDDGSIYIGFCEQLRILLETKSAFGIFATLLGVHSNSLQSLQAMYTSGPPTTATEGWSNGNSAPTSTVVYNGDVTNKRLLFTVNRLNIATKNMPDGIKTCFLGGQVALGGAGSSAISYNWPTAYPEIVINAPSKGLPGTSVSEEIVGTGDGSTVDFTTKFPFPSSATVYVDGVVCADVIVDEDRPGRAESASFFDFLHKESKYFLPFSLGYDRNTPYNANQGPLYGVASNGTKTGPGPYDAIFYNRCWMYGVTSLIVPISYGENISMEVSNDMIAWIKLPKATYTIVDGSTVYMVVVPEECRYYKYWTFYTTNASGSQKYANNGIIVNPDIDFSRNIHFTTPPAEGSVITIDYYTPVVAKDENHVFDLTVTIQLGEYNE